MLNEEEIKKIGIAESAFISPSEIVFDDEVRKICEKKVCRLYGKTWACPPAVGDINECRQKCLQYEKAFIFNAVYALEDSFDYEGMIEGHRKFKKLCDDLYSIIKLRISKFLLLSNEGCNRCEACTYPTDPCRFPQLLFPSLEGFGINVLRLAASAGLNYRKRENSVTYFGMLLY